MAEFAPLEASLPPFDENGEMTLRFQLWAQAVNKLAVIPGTGSPEGVIEAEADRFYKDVAGGVGTILYIKNLDDIGGDRSLGWVLV